MTNPRAQMAGGEHPMSNASSPGPTLLGLLSLLAPQFRWTVKTFYSYPGSMLPLAASDTDNIQNTIDSETHFIFTYAQCIVTDTTNLVQLTFIPQLVQWRDSSAQNELFQESTHAMNVYGDGSNPGIMALPYPVSPSATFTIQHQNLEATDRNVYVAMNGFNSWPGTDTRDPRWQSRR